jgi:hypothetical protein
MRVVRIGYDLYSEHLLLTDESWDITKPKPFCPIHGSGVYYLCGDNTGVNQAFYLTHYDKELDRWTDSSSVQDCAIQPHTMFNYLDMIVVIFDADNLSGFDVYYYDPHTNTWGDPNELFTMPVRSRSMQADQRYLQTQVIDSKIYLLTDACKLLCFDPVLDKVTFVQQYIRPTNSQPMLAVIDNAPVPLRLISRNGFYAEDPTGVQHQLLSNDIVDRYKIKTRIFKVTFRNDFNNRTIICSDGHWYYAIIIVGDHTSVYKTPPSMKIEGTTFARYYATLI